MKILRRAVSLGLALTVALSVTPLWAQPSPATALPESVTTALARARVPLDAVSFVVVDADGQSAPRLSHRADAAMNPASVMKLVTTFAALDLLGPAYQWRTSVWADGPVTHGVLKGNLVIAGQGDPKLVSERLWQLLRRVQGLGILNIEGDIVLDRSAFSLPLVNPADFDGEPLRPYNASPDALLINLRSMSMTFVPDVANGVARVHYDLPLQGVVQPATVPLLTTPSDVCGDYRGLLKADFSDPKRIQFGGNYPSGCGEKVWPVAYSDPASYNARAVEGLWRSIGGLLTGKVRDGAAPLSAPSFELTSPPLAEVIRDINKYSNNVMAQQLFLTLARTSSTPPATATRELARDTVLRWWLTRLSPAAAPLLDNGSGLSRQERISAQALARLLQVAYASPFMPELMSSLPVAGIDGTLKRSRAAPASAHLKTGSLSNVVALAGYVHAAGGRQLCLVALINHANAGAARPAIDALLDWAAAQERR